MAARSGERRTKARSTPQNLAADHVSNTTLFGATRQERLMLGCHAKNSERPALTRQPESKDEESNHKAHEPPRTATAPKNPGRFRSGFSEFIARVFPDS
jgi:hypothetical protein